MRDLEPLEIKQRFIERRNKSRQRATQNVSPVFKESTVYTHSRISSLARARKGPIPLELETMTTENGLGGMTAASIRRNQIR